ncbi:MAG: hypothetical protein SGILL_000127 [Bacillariaceae sp.]
MIKPQLSDSPKRRQLLDSDISMALSKTSTQKDDSYTDTSPSPLKPFDPNQVVKRKSTRDLPCPNREAYDRNHRNFVNSSISDFKKRFPGNLREYRDMTLEEKSLEQQRVLALLTRIGISRGTDGDCGRSTQLRHRTGAMSSQCFESPGHTDRKRLLDETLSPAFTPELSPYHRNERLNETNLSQKHSPMVNEECADVEKSEILLSMDEGGGDLNQTSQNVKFPVRDKRTDDASVELVRRAPEGHGYSSEDDTSTVTPEELTINKSGIKRNATHSGKRGTDLQRTRLNAHHSDYRART